MSQYQAWENEYRNPLLVTNSNEPQLDFKQFVKWLRKSQKRELENLRVLDLGCGTGKNSIFLAERGCIVTGIELSETAVRIATERVKNVDFTIELIQGDIGTKWPLQNNSFDLLLDVVSSNSLSENEREICMGESLRVLQPGGYMFVKALSLDGDKNARKLLEKFPGKEKDTYVMPKIGITERVWSREDIESLYKDFKILRIERKSSYTIFDGKPFKRFFWLLYLQKEIVQVL